MKEIYNMFYKSLGRLFVRVADTPSKQSHGLMFVEKLPEDEGMFFIFDRTKVLSFWGENTFIPLDIAFVNEDMKIVKIANISPMSRKAISSDSPCRFALEVNYNYFKKNKIKVGDKIVFQYDEDRGIVVFDKEIGVQKKSTVKFQTIKTFQSKVLNTIPSSMESKNITDNTQPENYFSLSNEQNTDLPVINLSDLGNILEDDLYESQDTDQSGGLDSSQEQEGNEEQIPATDEGIDPASDLRNFQFNSIGEALQASVDYKQSMVISYTTTRKSHGKGGINIGSRVIEPHGVFTAAPENETPHQTVITFDETVGDIRAFRISNITGYSFTDRKFTPKFIVSL